MYILPLPSPSSPRYPSPHFGLGVDQMYILNTTKPTAQWLDKELGRPILMIKISQKLYFWISMYYTVNTQVV